jgi:hypothetical protein
MRIIRVALLLGLVGLVLGGAAGPVWATPLAQSAAPTTPPLVPVATPTHPAQTPTRTAVPADTLAPVPGSTVPTLVPPIALPTLVPSAGSSSAPNPRALIENTSAVMNRVTTMRFTGAMDMEVEAEGMTFVMRLPLAGDYVAPDRMHMTIEMRSMGFSGEMISVGGQVWTRAAGDPWDQTSATQFGAPVNPAQMSRLNPTQMNAILMNPTVGDLGTSYRLAGDVDVAKAMTESPTGSSVFGDNMIDTSAMDLSGATGRLTMSVNKTSMLLESMELVMTFPVTDPEGSIRLRATMSFADFNNPTIRVDPPTT